MRRSVRLEDALITRELTLPDQVLLVLSMSIPAILAQLTSIAMQYIDAGMVGSLGAHATAAIGLVSTSTWLLGGMCSGLGSGFSVQVAQLVGGGHDREASDVLRQALGVLSLLGLIVGAFGVAIGGVLPDWLGGEEEIRAEASIYFRIYCASIPFELLRQLSAGMMQCSGDMKTPSVLSAAVCVLDVIFNALLIFPTRSVRLAGLPLTLPGAGLGVTGAALGTALSEVVVSLIMIFLVCFRNKKLALRAGGSWRWQKKTIVTALKIAVPLSFDHVFMCSAYVAGTLIVAPLGTAAVAANSLCVTAESLCYMPGYGIGYAATALIGQSIGAGRQDLTKVFSRVSVALGMLLMACSAVFMYFFAPTAFGLLTSDAAVAALGVQALRIELLAEPFYGASICCAGVFRGAGDTLMPSVMNLISMWGVRLTLALFLVPVMGLTGYWTAMGIELFFRGVIFLFRLRKGKWMKKALTEDAIAGEPVAE